jgi:hypothetical protein
MKKNLFLNVSLLLPLFETRLAFNDIPFLHINFVTRLFAPNGDFGNLAFPSWGPSCITILFIRWPLERWWFYRESLDLSIGQIVYFRFWKCEGINGSKLPVTMCGWIGLLVIIRDALFVLLDFQEKKSSQHVCKFRIHHNLATI